MTYYFSQRALDSVGGIRVNTLTEKRSGKIASTLKILGGEAAREDSREISPNGSYLVNEFLKLAKKNRRHIAKCLHETVEVTQIIDVKLDLMAGEMKFHRIPGLQYSEKTIPKDISTFWSQGEEEFSPPWSGGNMGEKSITTLILVGSIDNIVGKNPNPDLIKYNGYNYPSDPSFMIEIVRDELELDLDLEDYRYESAWEEENSTDGSAAETANAIGQSAQAGHPSWPNYPLPQQRIVAVVMDIKTQSSNHRTILARPILIEATI